MTPVLLFTFESTLTSTDADLEHTKHNAMGGLSFEAVK